MSDALARVLALSLGGALGVNARYWLSVLIARWLGTRFPWATVLINVTGSFAIGFLAVFLTHRWPSTMGRLLLVTGFLGGYTTFSSFAYESLQLWEDGKKGLSLANTFGSVAAGLVAVMLGVALGRAVFEPSLEPSPGAAEHARAERLPTDEVLEGEVADG